MFGLYDKHSLFKKIKKTAKKDKLPENHELLLLAEKLEQVTNNKDKTPEMIIEAHCDAQKAYNEYLAKK